MDYFRAAKDNELEQTVVNTAVNLGFRKM